MLKSEIKIPLAVSKSMREVYLQNYECATCKSGKIFVFAGDQKIEHLNADFYGRGVPEESADPEHLFKIASKGKIGVFATNLGLISLYGESYNGINYVVKLNGKTNLVPTKQKDPLSLSHHSVDDIVLFAQQTKLNVVGVGYTVYLGSEFESQMLAEAAQIVHRAHKQGLLAILWMYPRGKAVKDELDSDLIAGAAGVAAALGADFVKVNPPKGKDSAELLKQATKAAGRTKVICSGGSKKDTKEFLQLLHDQIHIGGAQGCALGRNIHQRSLNEAIALCEEISHVLE